MESHWSICYWMKQQWLQCYNAWNSTEHNGIKWNVSDFIVLFNGIPLQAMLLKGTSMNCMFHWKSIPLKSMLLKGALVKSRIEHQWNSIDIEWNPMEPNAIQWNINEFNAILIHPTELSVILNRVQLHLFLHGKASHCSQMQCYLERNSVQSKCYWM